VSCGSPAFGDDIPGDLGVRKSDDLRNQPQSLPDYQIASVRAQVGPLMTIAAQAEASKSFPDRVYAVSPNIDVFVFLDPAKAPGAVLHARQAVVDGGRIAVEVPGRDHRRTPDRNEIAGHRELSDGRAGDTVLFEKTMTPLPALLAKLCIGTPHAHSCCAPHNGVNPENQVRTESRVCGPAATPGMLESTRHRSNSS